MTIHFTMCRVKGDSKSGKESIIRCSDRRKKPDSGESEEDFLNEMDAPCTEEVEVEEDSSAGIRSKMAQLNLVFSYMRNEDFGPYTCITKPQDSPTDVEPFGTTIYVQRKSLSLAGFPHHFFVIRTLFFS